MIIQNISKLCKYFLFIFILIILHYYKWFYFCKIFIGIDGQACLWARKQRLYDPPMSRLSWCWCTSSTHAGGESNRFVNVELYKYCYGPPLFEGTHIMIKQLMWLFFWMNCLDFGEQLFVLLVHALYTKQQIKIKNTLPYRWRSVSRSDIQTVGQHR